MDSQASQGNESQPKPVQDSIEQLAQRYADDFDSFNADPEEGVSLEELSRTYRQVMQAQELTATGSGSIDLRSSESGRTTAHLPTGPEDDLQLFDDVEADTTGSEQFPATPQAILEAVLLVGRPDGGPITATEIAALMRGVTEDEVDRWVAELNAEYVANGRALNVASVGGGYRMQVTDDLGFIVQRLLGPQRPVKLSQPVLDCLALISYQPGISRDQLDLQLGKSSGPILNQLVRRQLLEMRRQPVEQKMVPRYYPTQRLIELVGLESLDDLPVAEEWNEPA